MDFPESLKDESEPLLVSRSLAGSIRKRKPWKGEGPGVLEIVSDHRGDTYRSVYTVKFEHAIYVLHAFQKKSPKGRKTSQSDVDLISHRLRIANEDYEARYGKRSN